MIEGLDSSGSKPTAALALAAKAAGYGIWSGYLATRPGVNLYAPWAQTDFQNAWLCGNMPLAYCSGYDDPVACRNQAAVWKVRLVLDVENGIRGIHNPDASWIQPFLDASGAGLYGGAQIQMMGFVAPFYILGAYPTSGDPTDASWNTGGAPLPSAPHGWQWAGSHDFHGATVDSTTFDNWFATPTAGDDDMPTIFAVGDAHPDMVYLVVDKTYGPKRGVSNPAEFTAYAATMADTTIHTLPQFVMDKMPDMTTNDLAALIASGGINVDALATALAAHLPPGSDPAVVAKAVADMLAARLVS